MYGAASPGADEGLGGGPAFTTVRGPRGHTAAARPCVAVDGLDGHPSRLTDSGEKAGTQTATYSAPSGPQL